MPDDPDQSPQSREPAEEKIHPREWLRRLEERRAQEGSPRPTEAEAVSASAEEARRRLREEIEGLRASLAGRLETESEKPAPTGRERSEEDLLWREVEALRWRLDALDKELSRSVKRRVRKSERRLSRSIEKRVEKAIEKSRLRAEAQVRADLERMLDDLLGKLRSIGRDSAG